MIRVPSALALLSVATLLAGCPNVPEPATCGSYERMVEELDLSACSSTELSQIQRTGIWHGRIEIADDPGQRMTIDFTEADNPLWDGSQTYLDDFGNGRFYMQQAFVDTVNQLSLTTSLLGCRSASTGKVTGLVQICATGGETSNTTFELTRLDPIAGEGQSSGGLTLVSERTLSDGTPRHLTIDGSYAYVVTASNRGTGNSANGGLSVVDLATNQECGRLPAPMVALPDGRQVQDPWTQSVLIGDQLYVGSLYQGLLLVEFAGTRCSPQWKTSPRLPGTGIQAMIHDPGRKVVFAASAFGEIYVLNVATPSSPVKVNQFKAAEDDYTAGKTPQGMFLAGNRLYVNYGAAGYVIFEIPSTLLNGVPPSQLGSALAPDGETSVNNGVFTVADKTYALETIQGWGGHVRILDVTNPMATTTVGSYATRTEISVAGMDLVGSRLYLAHHQDGLRIVDFANPAAPEQKAHFNTWDLAKTTGNFFEGLVAVQASRDGSGLIYALDTQRGLMVFDETP